jgi:hypothetical protein
VQELLALTGGVPWDVAMEMDETERRAFCIAKGTAEGGVFDWNALTWKSPNG